jgi:branched-chain amino acid transport system permease protein
VAELLQHGADAIVLGGTYALLGIGLTLILGIMNVVNFTHGDLYAFGAYMVYLLATLLGLNFFLSILLAGVLGFALGALIEFVLLRPILGADIDTTMLVMIGASIGLQASEQWIWGGAARSVSTPFSSEPVVMGPVSILPIRIFVPAVAVLLLVSFYLLVNRTRFGMSMRATFQDPDTAALMGVNRGRIYTLTFALGSSLAALGGALLGPVFVVTPTMGNIVALKAFAIVILGGLGNIVGATIGGFVLAFAEQFGAAYISSGYRDAMGFLLIAAVLVIRPQGFFAAKERVG